MRILGIDTATRHASVGVLLDGVVAAEQSHLSSSNHAATLLPLVESVLGEAGCAIGDVDAVAVSAGPGSFSGLRIGLSVAKALAWACGKTVIPVPTLEALARTVADRAGVICAVLDARKGELYTAAFASSTSGWQRLTPDALVTPDTLLAQLQTPCVILGDATVAYGAMLQAQLGPDAVILPFETYAPRGGVVALMAWEHIRAGKPSADLLNLEPVYVRASDAELKQAARGTQ